MWIFQQQYSTLAPICTGTIGNTIMLTAPLPAKHRTRVEMVMHALRGRIANRTLVSGAKLPSIRSMAASLQVSISTTVEAYDRLAAEGTITARRGSGFFVAAHVPPLTLAEIGPRLDRAVDPLWVSRQSLDAGVNALMPGCGWLPASWMPVDAIQRGLRSLARHDESILTGYSTSLGYAPLRQILAQRMADHGVNAAPSQIMLTESGTQAIDLLCRYLLEPGDTVLVDDPCYFNFQAMLRAHQAKVISVPYEPTGPNMEIFEKALREYRPRLYITNSGLHNPTGATLSPAKTHRLLKLAEEYKLTIIEYDIFADFEPEPASRLAAFDGLERVVHIGSFSKTLSASIRCGFIAARPDWIEGLIDMKIATSFGSSHFSAVLVTSILKDGTYRKHLASLRTKLADAMGKTTVKLRALGIKPWIEPRAGMFLWCELPRGLDATDVVRRALAEKIILAPGNAFSFSQSAGGFLRFNVAQSLDPRIYPALERAMERKPQHKR
jgi:DNA-binding transcriptional MocR family regulator